MGLIDCHGFLHSSWCGNCTNNNILNPGSADKTVKFWDLETFEMIGSARREVETI